MGGDELCDRQMAATVAQKEAATTGGDELQDGRTAATAAQKEAATTAGGRW